MCFNRDFGYAFLARSLAIEKFTTSVVAHLEVIQYRKPSKALVVYVVRVAASIDGERQMNERQKTGETYKNDVNDSREHLRVGRSIVPMRLVLFMKKKKKWSSFVRTSRIVHDDQCDAVDIFVVFQNRIDRGDYLVHGWAREHVSARRGG